MWLPGSWVPTNTQPDYRVTTEELPCSYPGREVHVPGEATVSVLYCIVILEELPSTAANTLLLYGVL